MGLLVASFDKNGPHVYQTCPSGNVYECYGSAIGARSQSGRTYLEKHYETFGECGKDDLIMHALKALVGCVSGDGELNKDNGSVAFVGKGDKFTILEGDDLQPYLDRLELEGGTGGGNGGVEEEEDDEDDGEGDVAMET